MCFWLRVRGFSALGFAWLWRCVGFRAVPFRAFSTVYRGLCGSRGLGIMILGGRVCFEGGGSWVPFRIWHPTIRVWL